MAHILGLVQVKGGAGRSTIATNLAGALSIKHKTALIDCDMPQGTSASWYAVRQQEGRAGNLTLATASGHVELVREVERLDATHDMVVIDAPPRIAEITRAILILSQLCLVPLGASAAEIWATSDLLNTIGEAKKAKPEVDARIVWTRYRASTKSAQELSEAVSKELGLKEMNARLGYRVAFSDALSQGRTALEWHDSVAREEMVLLTAETLRILKNKHRS